MAKIEKGKYYVDGEGFYKCVGKEENNINKYVRMDAVITRHKSLSYYQGLSYVEEACERRMVECCRFMQQMNVLERNERHYLVIRRCLRYGDRVPRKYRRAYGEVIRSMRSIEGVNICRN